MPASVIWAQVEPAFWVASTRGEFVGTVERVDGLYRARDSRAAAVGDFADLASAKRRVLDPALGPLGLSSAAAG